jgi:hypothetical protein
MRTSHYLSLAGICFSVFTIVVGVVALSTPKWIVLTIPNVLQSTYSLFQRCNKPLTAPESSAICANLPKFTSPQGLTIAGVALVGLGNIAAITIIIFVKNRWVSLLPQIFLISGPTLILVGGLYYVKVVLGNFSDGITQLDLGYSFILLVTTCILGYACSTYFAFVAGIEQRVNGSVNIAS